MQASWTVRKTAQACGMLALAATAVACGGSSSSGSSAPASGGSSATSAPAASTPAAAGTTITAMETEFMIKLDKTSVPAGTYTFNTMNMGKITHALEVDGPGVEDKSTGDISPGQSKTLTVTLKKGKYDIYCPVGNHKMLGMNDNLTVT